MNKTKGFTLIELLVVIAIISLLSSVVFASIKSARVKSRDARRFADVKQMTTALEFYLNDNGSYPQLPWVYTTTDPDGCGGGSAPNDWCDLETALEPYLSKLPRDPLGGYGYYYDANSGDNFISYGLITRFEDSSNADKSINDGGSLGTYYELGTQPSYCMNKYVGFSRFWFMSEPNVCRGGN